MSLIRSYKNTQLTIPPPESRHCSRTTLTWDEARFGQRLAKRRQRKMWCHIWPIIFLFLFIFSSLLFFRNKDHIKTSQSFFFRMFSSLRMISPSVFPTNNFSSWFVSFLSLLFTPSFHLFGSFPSLLTPLPSVCGFLWVFFSSHPLFSTVLLGRLTRQHSWLFKNSIVLIFLELQILRDIPAGRGMLGNLNFVLKTPNTVWENDGFHGSRVTETFLQANAPGVRLPSLALCYTVSFPHICNPTHG